MSLEYERSLSMEQLKQRNQTMRQPPMHQSEAVRQPSPQEMPQQDMTEQNDMTSLLMLLRSITELPWIGAQWEQMLDTMESIERLTSTQNHLLEQISQQLSAQNSILRELERCSPTEKQMETLVEKVSSLQWMAEQAGKKKERHFSLSSAWGWMVDNLFTNPPFWMLLLGVVAFCLTWPLWSAVFRWATGL